ncbi:MAG: hypothetical protein OZ948_19655 [Deltaproteobacteria bacterium]|nr:hypothetical protein [Deltaproteobacteria bacterium]
MSRRRYRTLEEREAVSRGLRRWHERRRIAAERRIERLRVAPQDLLAIEAGDVDAVRPELMAAVAAGADEAHALLEAQGGADHAGPARTIAAQDFGRLGAVMRGLLLRWAQTGDPELASRVATLSSARRGLLSLLGLDERRVERDLGQYLADRDREPAQDRAGGTIDVAPVREPAPADDAPLEPPFGAVTRPNGSKSAKPRAEREEPAP